MERGKYVVKTQVVIIKIVGMVIVLIVVCPSVCPLRSPLLLLFLFFICDSDNIIVFHSQYCVSPVSVTFGILLLICFGHLHCKVIY